MMQLREVDRKRHLAPNNWLQRTWNNIRRRFSSRLDDALKLIPTLDESDIIDVTATALGARLPAHIKFQNSEPLTELSKAQYTGSKRMTMAASNTVGSRPTSSSAQKQPMRPRKTLAHAALASSASPSHIMQRASANSAAAQPAAAIACSDAGQAHASASRGALLQEIVVQVDPRDLKYVKPAHAKIKTATHDMSAGVPASSNVPNAVEMAEILKPHGSRAEVELQSVSPGFGNKGLQLVKKREHRLAAQVPILATAVASTLERAEVTIKDLGPPPFDEDVLNQVRRFKEKAADGAAHRSASLTKPAAAASHEASTRSSLVQSDVIIDEEWTEYIDKSSGRHDHHNAASNKTRWDKPVKRSNLQNATETTGMSKVRHHSSRAEIGFQDLGPPPPFDDDVKRSKRREEKAAARAAQQSSLSASAAVASASAALQLSFAGVEVLGPPPPFDDEDLKLAKKREEKAAARAAQERPVLSSGSTESSGSGAHLRRISPAVADPLGSSPVHEDNLKVAKKREVKAATRADQRGV